MTECDSYLKRIFFCYQVKLTTLTEIGNNIDEGTEKEQIHPAYGAPFSINAKMKVVIQIYPL